MFEKMETGAKVYKSLEKRKNHGRKLGKRKI